MFAFLLIACVGRGHHEVVVMQLDATRTALSTQQVAARDDTAARDQRIAVVKMAAMLRVADALEASRGQRLHELRFSREGGRLVIAIPQVEDLSLEQLALKQSGSLFEETFGMPVLLRKLR